MASTVSDDPVSAWCTLGDVAPTQTISTAHSDSSKALFESSMKYGHGAGQKDVLAIARAITDRYHHAPHHVQTMTLASADGVTKVLRMVGAPGDYVLADEFTFAPLALAAEAHDVKWVPARIDSGGIIPDELEKTLENWDEKRGRRPHVLLTVP